MSMREETRPQELRVKPHGSVLCDSGGRASGRRAPDNTDKLCRKPLTCPLKSYAMPVVMHKTRALSLSFSMLCGDVSLIRCHLGAFLKFLTTCFWVRGGDHVYQRTVFQHVSKLKIVCFLCVVRACCFPASVLGGGVLVGQSVGRGGDERRGDAQNGAGGAKNVFAGEREERQTERERWREVCVVCKVKKKINYVHFMYVQYQSCRACYAARCACYAALCAFRAGRSAEHKVQVVVHVVLALVGSVTSHLVGSVSLVLMCATASLRSPTSITSLNRLDNRFSFVHQRLPKSKTRCSLSLVCCEFLKICFNCC